LTLGSKNKNTETQEHNSIRARRDFESERARENLSTEAGEIIQKAMEITTKAIETAYRKLK